MSTERLFCSAVLIKRFRPGIHRLLTFGLIAVVLVAETAIRFSTCDLQSATDSQKLVIKFLNDERPAIAIGDSRIGGRDRLPEFAFLGRGGMTIHELVTIVEARPYATQRIIIEAGPQMFAKHRLVGWQTLQPGSFVHQAHLPFLLYLAEPELRNFVVSRLANVFIPRAQAMTIEEALEYERKFRQDAIKAGRTIRWTDRPAEIRRILSLSRRHNQRPAKEFKQTKDWRSFTRMIDRLAQRGTNVCLIRAPVNFEYEKLLVEQWNSGFGQHRTAVETLAKNTGVTYVDYTDIGFKTFPLKYFNDNDHLNQDGHKIYWPCLRSACFGDTTPPHCEPYFELAPQ